MDLTCLTKRQREIWTLMYGFQDRDVVAEKLGITRANVNVMLSNADMRITAAYLGKSPKSAYGRFTGTPIDKEMASPSQRFSDDS